MRFSAEELTAPAAPNRETPTEAAEESGGVYTPEDAEGLAVAAQEDGIERRGIVLSHRWTAKRTRAFPTAKWCSPRPWATGACTTAWISAARWATP